MGHKVSVLVTLILLYGTELKQAILCEEAYSLVY